MNYQQRQEWLDGIKAGDEVVIEGRYGNPLAIVRVERRTPSGLIVVREGSGTTTFSKGGLERDQSAMDRRKIAPVTPEIRDAADRQLFRQQIEAALKGGVSTDQLRRAANILSEDR